MVHHRKMTEKKTVSCRV